MLFRGAMFQRPLTSSNWDADQIVDESEDKVDPDPFHRLFGEVDAGDDIQEIVLQRRRRSASSERQSEEKQQCNKPDIYF